MEGEDLEQLITGKARVVGVKVYDQNKLRITLEVNGRAITLEGLPDVGPSLKLARPWEEAGWLEAQMREQGSLRAVARAYSLSDRALKLMYAYAHNQLGWRVQEGTELKRWTFLERYFALADPSARPTIDEVAKPLGITQGHASKWIAAALKGQFFSSRFSPEKLAAIQSRDRLGSTYVYFPGSDLTLSDFPLAQADGWPDLPIGLLSDLLPRLSSWETRSFDLSAHRLRASLRHEGHLVDFEVDVTESGEPFALDDEEICSVRALKRGLLCFVLKKSETIGRVSKVYKASAGSRYVVRS